MDSMRASEAPDAGSIPVEATTPESGDFSPFLIFAPPLKPLSRAYISRTASLIREVRY